MRFIIKSSKSLPFTFVAIIVLCVSSVLSLEAAFEVYKVKQQTVSRIELEINSSLSALRQNMKSLIESYSINEYEKLIQTEIEQSDYYAIIVDDFNMAKITGENAYRSARIRDKNRLFLDINSVDQQILEELETCCYKAQEEIRSSDGKLIGTISIYHSYDKLNDTLDQIIETAIIQVLILSLVLSTALLFFIRIFVLRPLSEIIESIGHRDETGIPIVEAPEEGPTEFRELSEAMNNMLHSIKESRHELKEQHNFLQTIIDSVEDSITVIGADYSIIMMNRAAQTSALNSDEKVSKCYELDYPHCASCEDSDNPCPLRNAIDKKQTNKIIHTHTQDGDIKHIEVSGTPLLDGNGSVIAVIEISRDVTRFLITQEQLRVQKDKLQYQAEHDALTGLANRVRFNDRLVHGIDRANRSQEKLALLFVDLDHFKEINDSLGHRAGDEALKIITSRLSVITRRDDTLARLGGDEFTIMIENITHPNEVSNVAQKVLETVQQPITTNGVTFFLGASIGISIFPDNGSSPQDLLKYADAAMYRAKNSGRNNFQFYSSEMTERAFEKITIEATIRNGIKNEEFYVNYQPQFNGSTNKIVGIEALVRLRNKEQGIIYPDKFIPIAESTGLIKDIDRQVMIQAMSQVVDWREKGINPGTLSLNLSVKLLSDSSFLNTIEEVLSNANCKAEWVEFEVTESQLMENPEDCISKLNHLNQLGFKISIDDFGTGYSSLSYLKKLPLSKLKIDRSFVDGLPNDNEDLSICKAIISMAKSLSLDIIAEGIETKDQKDSIIELGCEKIQGYFYSKPLSAEDLETLLLENH
jgi:diguanylate cyclase (GGDEF)-like protein